MALFVSKHTHINELLDDIAKAIQVSSRNQIANKLQFNYLKVTNTFFVSE